MRTCDSGLVNVYVSDRVRFSERGYSCLCMRW